MAANLQGKFSDESYIWVFLFHPENGHREYSELEARCEGSYRIFLTSAGTAIFFDTPPLQMVGTGAGLIYTRSDIAVR